MQEVLQKQLSIHMLERDLAWSVVDIWFELWGTRVLHDQYKQKVTS